MRLTAGARVGPYEVIAPLGAGGMGEVYRARDTRLGRDVALKVISDGAALESERLQRFEQEARLAGSLSHPNLVVVHDVGSTDGTPFLVTELLEGESLRQRLSHGRLPLRTALDLATQIAEGLAAAHARGVVHRDIKPENIFVTSGGRAKLLDFGIAKLTAPRPVDGARRLLDTTVTAEGMGTRPGAVLGTPGYMSPEQVRGDPVDARTDIFSLGAVLYEMLAGARAFPARSLVESGHAILESEPAPLPDTVPPWVDLVVRRCLEKEPARRFQSAADLAFALGAVTAPTAGAGRPLTSRASGRRWMRLALVLGAIQLVGAAVAVTRLLSGRPADELPRFERLTFREGPIGGARFTPEGRVVFSAPFDGEPEEVYVRARGSPDLQPFGLGAARLAAVSPKTGELAILLGSESIHTWKVQGTLALLPTIGGTPRELAERVAWADWTGTGDLAVARRGDGKMWIERPLGTVVWNAPGVITDLRSSSDGEHLAFIHVHPGAERIDIVVLDRSNKARVLTTSAPDATISSLAWRPDGKGLRFTSDSASATTLDSVSLTGSVHRLYQFPGWALLQDIAPDGTMLFTIYDGRRHLDVTTATQPIPRELSWFDGPDLAALSADGSTVLFDDGVEGQGGYKVLLRETRGKPPKVLGPGWGVALSPDGKTVAMASPDHRGLRLVPTGPGVTQEVALSGVQVAEDAGAWSRDGRTLWFVGRPGDQPGPRLYSVDVAARKLLGPVPGVDVLPDTPIALSPDETRIAVSAPDRVLSVHSLPQGRTLRLTSIAPEHRPIPAGWATDNDLWLCLLGATPRRLVRVDLRTEQVTRSRDIELRRNGAYEVQDARISRDESVVVVQYIGWRARLELMHGLPPDR